MKAIVCLDLGTKTGWAVRLASGQVQSGTQGFTPKRFEGGGMRYLKFTRWLETLWENCGGIDYVAFEEVRRHIGVDAAHAYGGFLASLTSWCESHGLPYEGVPVGTVKKSATGKGNAGKEQVADAMRALGFAPGDDNEADALAILGWTLAERGIPFTARPGTALASLELVPRVPGTVRKKNGADAKPLVAAKRRVERRRV